jgi:AraC family transcriptional regulator
MLTPRIENKPELKVIGLEAAFINALSPDATNLKVIGPLWDQFCHLANKVPSRVGTAMIGVIYGRPEAQRAHPDELQYIASVPVSSTAEVPSGLVARTVAAGTFAVFIHRGPIQGIGETVREIYRIWLPQSGYRHAGIADVELYDERFHCDRETSEMEYWVSVCCDA